jgi:16S rRNA processing protein RimM
MSASENKPIIIGQVSGVFGVHGWVKIFSHTDPRDNILQYNPWLLKTNEGWQSVSFIKGRKQGKTIVAQLKGVDDREKAHALIGTDIAIDESQLKELDKNDFYWRDLEGLQVTDVNEQLLGTVTYMMATGANDVMVVKLSAEIAKSKDEKETLIPYLMDSVVTNVDLVKGIIQVDWDLDFD